MIRSSVADKNYLVIGGNIDPNIKQKILNHEYVDFAKLLPKGKIARDDDGRMEIVCRGGATFFVPASDHDNASISNFSKWEQAFRVFSNIYS